jgi:hypothetical protein
MDPERVHMKEQKVVKPLSPTTTGGDVQKTHNFYERGVLTLL